MDGDIEDINIAVWNGDRGIYIYIYIYIAVWNGDRGYIYIYI